MLNSRTDGAVAMPENPPGRSFYCMADARYFLGAVALVNSLRLVGHAERIVLLDCGLDDRQRSLLAREALVLPETPGTPDRGHPFAQRVTAPLGAPAASMILLDADVIVTSPLDVIFEQAAAGSIVAFADALSARFNESWEGELSPGLLRRQTYVNAGFLALPLDAGTRLLRRLEQLVIGIDTSKSFWTKGVPEDPFFFLDQDVLNALLATEVAQDRLVMLPYGLAPHPPFAGLVVDRQTLRARRADGTAAFLLHHVIRKPWLETVAANAYSELLPRLLLEPDLPIRVGKRDVPRRLREDLSGRATRRRISASIWLRARRRRALRRPGAGPWRSVAEPEHAQGAAGRE